MGAAIPVTRPPATRPEDYAKLGAEMDSRSIYRSRSLEDSRLSQIFMWGATIIGSIMTFAVCYGVSAVINTRSDVAILLSRPPSVAKDQYDRDYDRLSQQVNRVEARLQSIEDRQINTVTKRQ